MQAWVGVGSADEAPAQAGVAHVVEHMLFKGGGTASASSRARSSARGGEINAWTSFDHTVYHAVLGRDHVDAAIDALGDALIAPRVDPRRARARARGRSSRRSARAPTIRRAAVAQSLFATAFVAHPYRRPVIGTADSVRRLGERELVEFFRSYYVADNVDARRRGRRRSGSACGAASSAGSARCRRAGRARRRDARAGADGAARGRARCATSARRTSRSAFTCRAARHPDVAALDVAAILLGESESARLPRALRDATSS